MKRSLTLKRRVLKRIARKTDNVLLRDDVDDLGGYDQIGRVLKQLVAQGKLVRIGYGLYAKAKLSALTGETVPVATLPKSGKEALSRLNVKTLPATAEEAYQQGCSTRVPTGRMIGVKSRISRKIGYKGAYLAYEHVKVRS